MTTKQLPIAREKRRSSDLVCGKNDHRVSAAARNPPLTQYRCRLLPRLRPHQTLKLIVAVSGQTSDVTRPTTLGSVAANVVSARLAIASAFCLHAFIRRTTRSHAGGLIIGFGALSGRC